MKYLRLLIFLLMLGMAASAQETTIVVSYETMDARQFGYKPYSHGLIVLAAHRFNPRWEGIAAGETSDAHKAYVGNGRHSSVMLGARYYLTDAFFVTAGASGGMDRNTDYTKIASRGFIGVGIKYGGVVGTLTAFAPPSTIAVDPNQVKGVNATMEYFRPVYGPLGIYGAAQSSLASFNQTGGDPNARFSAMSWKARAGFYLSF